MPKLILALVLLVAISSSLAGQRLPERFAALSYGPAPDGAAGPSLAADLRDSTASRTYWLEGAFVGGVPLALLGAIGAGWACSESEVDHAPCWDNELLGAAFGFGIGASVGALIGGQIKKKEKTDSLPR